MTHAIALLCSRDAEVIDAVRIAVSGIDGLTLDVCAGPNGIVDRLAAGRVAVILLHHGPADELANAEGLLGRLKALPRPAPVLVLSDTDDVARELALFRLGVTDYLARPLDLRRLTLLLDVHTVEARLARGQRGGAPVEALGGSDLFLYADDADMGRLMDQVRRVAPQNTTVLLGGETGSGKTRLARLIHELSGRRHEPFLTVNCGSLSENLVESEMFGHVRGAFTGADRDRAGKFAEVGEGTLLLDDVDALPPALQAKLLRAVDERVFEPVGSNRPLPLRARLVAASNRPLDREAAAGRFRSDLYYRLNVVSFELPPLRERRRVVPAIARKFLAEYAASTGRPVRGITPAALAALEDHAWPGNVRELRNVIERAVALCPGDAIDLDDLPDALRRAAPASAPAPILIRTKEEAELVCITDALERHGNNRLRAAASLGISRMTLYKKLHKYGLMGVS